MPTTQVQGSGNPSFEVDEDGIGWITFDDPNRKLNILDEPVMRRLATVLDSATSLAEDGSMTALIVRSGKARGFVAGADVTAIEAVEDPAEGEQASRLGQEIFGKLEALPVPTTAAIHGLCLGGGTELALSCDYRLASDSPTTGIGLPEVMLGILPAWGGTTRLPRLVGLQAALDLLLSGGRARASKAKRIGLVDEIFPKELFDEKAKAFASDRADGKPPKPRPRGKLVTRLLDGTPPGRAVVLRMARKQVMKRTGGHYPAPLKILDVVKKGGRVRQATALALEADAAGQLIVSSVSKNLIHIFNLNEAAKKGLGALDAEATHVGRLGVLGAGVMGGGIAQLAAYKGIVVRMKDIRHEAISGGLQHARGLFDKAVQRRRLRRREADQHMELISGGLDYQSLSGCDLIVEAVVERMDVKRIVLRETEDAVRADCIIASNTSSLSIDEMSEGLRRPENLAGMHFFNPVHKMPLVEVVRGSRSSDRTVATIYALALELGKVPVVTSDGPGFLVNRVLGPYLNEAGHLLADGASIEDVDRAATDFGMPMGPLRLVDEVGIDVSSHAGDSLHKALGDRLDPSAPLVALADSGRLGKKGGSGFYRYENGAEAGVDQSVYAALKSAVPAERRTLDQEEIRGRLVLAMINEAARALDEGVVARAADVDLAMIMGTGFPPFLGGLMRFADTIHLKTLLSRLQEMEDLHGQRFTPAPLIARLAAADRSFYDTFGD
ncbi:MAG: fatty acid oxidation complex subunit alpha FadJ [Gemmatimonadota bacterium]|nr:MAG: fatty acid oxidation complex subunit alpha FadJ [Gemmatimonadota bacterium]